MEITRDDLGNLVSSENSLKEFGARITSADIRVAHGRGLRHLKAHFMLARHEAEGFFSVPVTSRLLESALTLHLLRRIGRDPDWQRRLELYLLAELAGADAISSLAARAVLNLPLDMDAALAAQCFADRAEYGHRRKRAFLTMLLVEMGAIPFRDAGILPEEYGDRAVHRFSRIYAAALRLMHNRFQPLNSTMESDQDFLAGAQNPNGSWEQQALITLVVLLALGPAHPGFERGFNYVQNLRRDDGGVPFIDNQNNWVSCVAGLALQAAGYSEDRLARFIANRQHGNGGWSFTDGVTQTDADVSANSTQVLLQHGDARYSSNIQRALEYLGGLQREDGGYPTYEREGESEATMTANILLAQSLADLHGMEVSSHKMHCAVAYLADRQRRDGSFEMSWSRSETYSIFRVLWALDVYHQSQTSPCRGTWDRRRIFVPDQCLSHSLVSLTWSCRFSGRYCRSLYTLPASRLVPLPLLLSTGHNTQPQKPEAFYRQNLVSEPSYMGWNPDSVSTKCNPWFKTFASPSGSCANGLASPFWSLQPWRSASA